MALVGKRVMIVKGRQKYAYGTVLSADRDALRLLTDDGELVYDRLDNIIRAKEND